MRTATFPPPGRDPGSAPGEPARARRLRAPSWRDPRLVVGVVLVLTSVVLGARTVQAARATTGVWALAAPVGAGTTLLPEHLHVVQVGVDSTTGAAYVPADEALTGGWVAVRGLSPGELLPRSAVAPPSALQQRAVSLSLTGSPPDGVRVGALAELWVAWPEAGAAPSVTSPGTSAQRPRPERLVEAAEVVDVQERSAALAGASGADVQVLVPRAALPDVLQALAVEADVVLVPVPGGGGA